MPNASINQMKAKVAMTTNQINQKLTAQGLPKITVQEAIKLAKLPPGLVQPLTEVMMPNGKWNKIMGGLAAANSVLPPSKQINPQNVKTFVETAFSNIKPPSKGEQFDVMNASYGLSKAPNPKPVMLNSGIAPPCYANDFMTPVENSCSPMHVSAQVLGLPQTAANTVCDYLLKTIAFDIQTRAQVNVNFNLDLTVFSATQIVSSMNDVIRALQVYFYYTSILSYEANTRNKNSAMIDLRSKITSQMISDLTSLGRRLEDTPCPPRIVQWIRYMSMNYLSGNSQGAPLIKIAPSFDFNTNTTLIASTLTTLTSTANTNLFVLMRRSIPQWRIGTLFDVPTIPVFDPNFLTIFANLSVNTYNGANANLYTQVTLTSDSLMYNSFDNRLDGAAFAMCSASVPVQGQVPGLSVPSLSGSVSSRKSFYAVSGVISWYDSSKYQFLAVNRAETYRVVNLADTTLGKAHLSGAEMCQGVSVDSLVQNAKNFLDFLFNVRTIASDGKLSSFNKRGNNSI